MDWEYQLHFINNTGKIAEMIKYYKLSTANIIDPVCTCTDVNHAHRGWRGAKLIKDYKTDEQLTFLFPNAKSLHVRGASGIRCGLRARFSELYESAKLLPLALYLLRDVLILDS